MQVGFSTFQAGDRQLRPAGLQPRRLSNFGKDPPRLALDSAVCQANPNCSLPKAVQLPTVSDVCFSFQPSDPCSMWIGASLDFNAAHKQVKVREQDSAGPRHALVRVCGSALRLRDFFARQEGLDLVG